MVKHRCHWVAVLALIGTQTAWGWPEYLAAWQNKYPSSTLPMRMQTTTGSSCHTCHHPPTRDQPGNCYRQNIIALFDGGVGTIEEALDLLDGEDSDGDGVANGEEATTARDDLLEEVGYSMGLVGPTGTDPCSLEPGVPITGQQETPPEPIPTVSEWGLAVMTLLLLVTGTVMPWSRRRPEPVRA